LVQCFGHLTIKLSEAKGNCTPGHAPAPEQREQPLFSNRPSRLPKTAVTLAWNSVTPHTYSIERPTDLKRQPAFLLLRSNITERPNTNLLDRFQAARRQPGFLSLRSSAIIHVMLNHEEMVKRHLIMAAGGTTAGNWFQAGFHLGVLVKAKPNDLALRSELQQAQEKLEETALALPRPESAQPPSASGCPARDSSVSSKPIDLSLWYNGLLTESWHGDGPGNDLTELLPGCVTELVWTDFDLRGVAQLDCRLRPVAGTNWFPKKVNGLMVQQKCRFLHFLHGAFFDVPEGSVIARYEANYGDGTVVPIPVILGDNIGNW
jgi:hypothetical protein